MYATDSVQLHCCYNFIFTFYIYFIFIEYNNVQRSTYRQESSQINSEQACLTAYHIYIILIRAGNGVYT